MQDKKSQVFISLLLIVMVSACNYWDEPKTIELSVPAKTVIENDTVKFVKIYRKILALPLPDSTMVDSLHTLFFIKGDISDTGYAYYFKYLTQHHDEGYSEGVGYDAYTMLKGRDNAPKRMRMANLTAYLPMTERHILEENITSIMGIDLLENNYTLTKYMIEFSGLDSEHGRKAFILMKKKNKNE